MKRIYSEYKIYYSNKETKKIWLEVSPIKHLKKHLKKYYPSAVGFKRIFQDGNSTTKYYKL